MLEVIEENMIYEIRGKQVMMDSDLAKNYNCKNGTKENNQVVRNNMNKFLKRFSWILTDEELDYLRSKILTKKKKHMEERLKILEFSQNIIAVL